MCYESIKSTSIPDRKHERKFKYPFDEMEINDFFVADVPYSISNMRKMGSAICAYVNKNKDKNFVQRKEGNKIKVYRNK